MTSDIRVPIISTEFRINPNEKGKKRKKWPRGQRNPFKRLISAKEIQGNASFFL